MKNFFITIEGVEGAGKSTLWRKLKSSLESSGIPCRFVREPGGTKLGETIRKILLRENLDIHPESELFLYAASRVQLVASIIKSSLERGEWVVADRYFDATIAYQGYGRGIELEVVKNVAKMSTLNVIPDLTIILDIEPERGFARINSRKKDRIESEGVEFMKRVRQGYLEIAKEEPERCFIVDADVSEESLWREVRKIINKKFNMVLNE